MYLCGQAVRPAKLRSSVTSRRASTASSRRGSTVRPTKMSAVMPGSRRQSASRKQSNIGQYLAEMGQYEDEIKSGAKYLSKMFSGGGDDASSDAEDGGEDVNQDDGDHGSDDQSEGGDDQNAGEDNADAYDDSGPDDN